MRKSMKGCILSDEECEMLKYLPQIKPGGSLKPGFQWSIESQKACSDVFQSTIHAKVGTVYRN